MRFANDFHSWLCHSWKSLANRLTRDPKIVIHGNSCIILYISIVLAMEILRSLDVAISIKHMTLFLLQDKKQNPINDNCFTEENVKDIIYIMSCKVCLTDKLPNMVYQYMNSSLPYNPILCDKLASGLNKLNWDIYITSQLRYICFQWN